MFTFIKETVISTTDYQAERIGTTSKVLVKRFGEFDTRNIRREVVDPVTVDSTALDATAHPSAVDTLVQALGAPTVFKRDSQPAVSEEIAWTTPASISAGYYRLILRLNLVDNRDAEFARDLMYEGKDLVLEFRVRPTEAVTNNKEDVTDLLVKKFNAALRRFTETPLVVFKKALSGDVKATNTGDTALNAPSGTSAVVANDLIATAFNQFVRFSIGFVGPFEGDLGIYSGAETNGILTFETPFVTGGVSTIGKTDFGTTAQINRDIRLRTNASIAPYTEDFGEQPIPNSTYTQYTFDYVVERGDELAGQAGVGSQVTSKTTHVLYVLSTLTSDFETAFTSAGATIDTVL